jgi:hypothetical protein
MKSREIICTTILSVLVYFAFSPQTRAACGSPDPGCPGANLAEGYLALAGLTTGVYNTGIGTFSLLSLTDGNFNTGIGAGTLLLNTAAENTATGAGALLSNTAGTENTGNGAFALFSNTTGENNTAIGAKALQTNTEGSNNVAVGVEALLNNTGGDNTALGAGALRTLTNAGNTNGSNNVAVGVEALSVNTEGSSNVALGSGALFNNRTGIGNTAVGPFTLQHLQSGNGNTALGSGAGDGVTTATGVICIGIQGADVSNSCYIGNIFGATSSGGTAVFINSVGKLGTTTSSRRFKEEIKPMERVSEALFTLKPVTFRYKQEIDPNGTPQFGLVAEEVEKVNPDLVVRDKEGKPYSVRYDQVNAMLLNEFLKEHRKVEQLTRDFDSKLAEQQKQIEALTAGLQKVSAQFEANKPAPQVVNNP